jgi:hypothetical protein
MGLDANARQAKFLETVRKCTIYVRLDIHEYLRAICADRKMADEDDSLSTLANEIFEDYIARNPLPRNRRRRDK